MKNTVVTNSAGVKFAVRVVEKGDRYGYQDCKTFPETKFEREAADKGDVLVEFWDVEYSQFVSRYYLSTLRNHMGGISLDGGVPRWSVSRENVREAVRCAESS